jgi:glucose/arabinose dehydrogenase
VAATLKDFRITLSRLTTRPGKIVFNVVNKGAVRHDLVFAGAGGKRTKILRPGQRQTITVPLTKAGLYRFYCSIPGHRALGMTGAIRVGAGAAPKPPAPPATPAITKAGTARLTQVASGLAAVTGITSPPGDTSRVMIVQQSGLVSVLRDGALQPAPFLDIRDQVTADGEKGLLSLAFAPDYATSGHFYVDYNDHAGNLHVVELHRVPGDPDRAEPTGRELLEIPKPTADHNGGMLQFGPDGYLYVAVGDGGADLPKIPVGASGQTLDDYLGSILRIDPRGDPYAVPPSNPFVAVAGARPEIVAYGLRNPWRFWIDAQTNEMLIGDVGENTAEEIDRMPLDHLGLDFGWPCAEGAKATEPDIPKPVSCATAALTPPLFEYPHSATRCSITGGVVVRDPRLPMLVGSYLWGDLCDGGIYSIDPAAAKIVVAPLGLSAPQTTSFGVDAAGQVYVGTAGGVVYRFDPP